MNQNNTPFFDALLKYAKNDKITPFDVPGHHLTLDNEFNQALKEYAFRLDANAPLGLDNLSYPTGVVKEAEQLFAQAFKADHSLFLVNGTTIGIMALIMATVNSKEKIILPRNVHKSAINGLIISGAIPVFVDPVIDEKLGIAQAVGYEEYEKAILENPDTFALLVINPTYFGATTELEKIVKLAHQKNIIVLADEAHGSHLGFCVQLPLSAMEAGVDASCISMHKTGGSLTQSSAILLQGKLISQFKLQKTINILQSTSPSSLLIASLDVARKQMYFQGKTILEDLINYANEIRNKINKLKGFYAPDKDYFLKLNEDFDDTKLIIQVNELGFSGFEIYNLLRKEYDIQMELAETNVVLAIIAIGTTHEHLDNLYLALKDISKRFYQENNHIEPPKFKYNFPKAIYRPREAHMAPKKRVALEEAVNGISAESVMIYPPGIPLLIPGEQINEEVIKRIRFYQEKGSIILSDFDDGTINIVDEEKWNTWRVSYDEI